MDISKDIYLLYLELDRIVQLFILEDVGNSSRGLKIGLPSI